MSTYPPPYSVSPAERVRVAWQRRHETDYIFNFWTALGWTVLTCGFWGMYGFYQLMRRMRDHNRRRLDLLEAANEFAWDRANSQGVAEELRSSIFEPFRRGPDAPRHSPGVGIGLSLVARFAELHGGRAWVQERPGGGASFKVILREPTAPAREREPAAVRSA